MGIYSFGLREKMPKQTHPLENEQIENCKPSTKTITLYDGRGLLLRVQPSGNKIWYYNYVKPFTKKRTNIKLGDYPPLTLEEARSKREHFISLLKKGEDPMHWQQQEYLKHLESMPRTVKQVAETWLQLQSSKVTKRHLFNIRRSLELHVFPFLGDFPVKMITPLIVIQVLKPLENVGKLETLSRLCTRVNQLMDWCVNYGIIESHRLNKIKSVFIHPKATRMKTIKPCELPMLMHSINTSNIDIIRRSLLVWQMHTMVRPGEAVKARWKDIDLANRIWDIPAEFMKMRRPHQVPLSPQCIDILDMMKSFGECEYVFQSFHRKGTHVNKETANNVLKKIGYNGKLVAHGMRALASTVLNEHDFKSDWIEMSLAHGDENFIRSIYNNAEYLAGRREMHNWWSNYIEQAEIQHLEQILLNSVSIE